MPLDHDFDGDFNDDGFDDVDFDHKDFDEWLEKRKKFTSMYSTQAPLEPRTGLKVSAVLLLS